MCIEIGHFYLFFFFDLYRNLWWPRFLHSPFAHTYTNITQRNSKFCAFVVVRSETKKSCKKNTPLTFSNRLSKSLIAQRGQKFILPNIMAYQLISHRLRTQIRRVQTIARISIWNWLHSYKNNDGNIEMNRFKIFRYAEYRVGFYSTPQSQR